MNRLFSVTRRRPHVVDVSIPLLSGGVDGYRLQWATNFDAAFTAIITATNVGFLDSNVNRNVIETQPVTDKVRIVFDPTTYSIPDTSSFWLQFVPMTGGAPGTAGAPTLILPSEANHGVGLVVIHGNAPSAASSAASLQLDLPRLMQDFKVHNESTTKDLFIATEASGPEILVPKTSDIQSLGFVATQGSLYVRGDSAIVAFSASFTLSFPR
jgi:hypothetical protein